MVVIFLTCALLTSVNIILCLPEGGKKSVSELLKNLMKIKTVLNSPLHENPRWEDEIKRKETDSDWGR